MRAFLLMMACLPATADTLQLVAPDYWCPFSCRQNEAQAGFTIDIARAIYTPLGYTLRYRNRNYARAIAELRRGQFDAIPSVIQAEAPDLVFPRQPISRNRFCVYAPADASWTFQQAADLNGRRIGLVQAYDYGPAIQAWQAGATAQVEWHGGDDVLARMLGKLRLGRLDALIEEESLVDHQLARQPGSKLHKAGCLSPSYGYLGISPRHPKAHQLAEAFDQGMARLRRDGSLARIMQRYGLQVWPAPLDTGRAPDAQ